MSRIFISYSSTERNEALAIQRWLEDNGWDDDVFVDVDPQFGIAGGSSWREALRAASNRCEAILLLLSRNWLASKSCWSEFVLAEKHGKPIIPIKIDPNLPDPDDLPDELTNYQIIDKANISETEFVTRLRYGLEKAGAGPENFPLMQGRPPYPGLKALTESDAALFFGRDAEVLSALDTLREIRDTGRKRIFVILGASGSGKSSLLRAGLWPRINRNDRQFLALPTVRPGNAPLTGPQGFWQALATALSDERRAQHIGPTVPRTATALRVAAEQQPDAVSNVVRALQQAAFTSFADPHAPVPSVVLSIDQGEELMSGEDGAESDRFLRIINKLITDIPELIVIVAIRSDEYPQLQNDERFPQDELRPFNLSAMGPAGLARVISGPANRVGLVVDPQLHSLLTQESSGADALPLLAFTLERLYTERLEPQRISLEDYRRLGGAAGAISASADVVRSRAIQSGIVPERYDALLRRVFLPHLARVNEAGEFARRIAKRSDLDPASQPLVDLLIEQRLLVMDQVGEGPTLEVAHEAILREWPLLAGWLNAEKGFLEWREEVARTRKLAEAGQDDLLTGRALAVAQSFIDTREADIAEIDRKFIRDSIDAETARKQAEEAKQEAMRQAELNAAQAREEAAQTEAAAQTRIAAQAKRATRRLAALAVLLTVFAVGAAGAGVWAYMSQQEAVAATKVAQMSQKESESRRLASLASDLRGQGGDDKAMALSWLAMPHDEEMASTPITDEAASELYRRSIMPIFEIEGHIKSYFPEEGTYIASLLQENRAILWDSETLEIVAEFEDLKDYWDGYYYRDDPIAFTQDGERLHLIKEDQFVVYDIEEGAETVTMNLPRYETPAGEEELTHYYTASDSGSHLVVSTDRGQAAIYDVASGRQVLDLTVGP
ncbi:MAG: TIR domain-containing protein, partial [Henriciella sp.]